MLFFLVSIERIIVASDAPKLLLSYGKSEPSNAIVITSFSSFIGSVPVSVTKDLSISTVLILDDKFVITIDPTKTKTPFYQ